MYLVRVVRRRQVRVVAKARSEALAALRQRDPVEGVERVEVRLAILCVFFNVIYVYMHVCEYLFQCV